MNKVFLLIAALFLSLSITTSSSKAQTVELLAGNTLNGAVQGTLLGGASMALSNSDDFSALRIGVGLGTLYGVGMGAYDITTGGGQEVLVSGLFNDGNNSSIIVLLDTFYGAALGSVVVVAVTLVANERITTGLQYGAGIGAWAGFGFGIFDTFVLAERTFAPVVAANVNQNASGLIGMNFENKSSFGFINPIFIRTSEITKTDFNSILSPAVEVVNFRLNF
ncbi:MAG: hypothetical protein JJ892_13005 [Balneola sp.]|nr:hypothetical protein [Balneola sp.]MBO6652299.1 hypothetical protein [Balneola sp.]MBO6711459.1 hypothetical protein [Balneola sp.]MBO6801187.1 hypothetical protein [Balneola sp.]MBO6869395.1 hypothetical protein [Balneola sp.]